MAETTIEWADFTFNPWEGCQKVGPGCDHCYAEARNARFGGGVAPNWGPGAPRRRTSAANWRSPVKWNAEAAEMPFRPRVFCASLADVFDNQVPADWRADLFKLIASTPNLDWLLLTKRIGNVSSMLGDYKSVPLLPNVWLGITVVNQEEADRDIPKLLAVPARIRFLSMEPLLGPVTINPRHFQRHPDKQKGTDWDYEGINWVIAGGESGPGARQVEIEWIRSLVRQCREAGVAAFVKQMGAKPTWRGMAGPDEHWPDGTVKNDSGHGYFKIHLKDRAGGDMAEWPDDLRVRELPQ